MTYQADRPFTIYFVRHGITEPNFRGFRCGGDLDLPMMDIGCDQAYLLAKQIEKMHLRIGVIIAGSLIRTRQTAAIISGVLGTVPVELDPLMNERRLGQWNNRPISETEDMLKRGVTPPCPRSDALRPSSSRRRTQAKPKPSRVESAMPPRGSKAWRSLAPLLPRSPCCAAATASACLSTLPAASTSRTSFATG